MMDGCMTGPSPAVLFDDGITLRDVWALASGRAVPVLGTLALQRMARSAGFLDGLAAERRCIYGVTTGFGPLAGYRIEPALGPALQRKLIYHLASGVGAAFCRRVTRAIMAVRLATLAQGRSAVAPEVACLLAACLARDVVPVIPEIGTVGASGDLTPLAHLALALLGEGEVWGDGGRVASAAALAQAGLKTLTLAGRTALGLVNGTAAMTGLAALNSEAARLALDISFVHAVLYCEVLEGSASAFHEAHGRVRGQKGQIEAHARLNAIASLSAWLRPHADLPGLLPDAAAPSGVHERVAPVQDPYTLRCAPQILGAVLDVLAFHDGIVETEINAVTDNPIVLAEEDLLVHGGNFQGQHVAFAADALAMAVVKLAEYAERRIARLTDSAMNKGLGPFLTGGLPGLDSGFMGAQVTSSALLAEMRTRAVPACIQSVPTNANNQDTVSMGTIAARRCRDQLTDLRRILAIEALALAQAADLRRLAQSRPFAPATSRWVAWVREGARFVGEDRPLSGEIERLAQRFDRAEIGDALPR
jgi:tyrosine ammonia-lyase